jgi:vancomycin resistance protein YoaR
MLMSVISRRNTMIRGRERAFDRRNALRQAVSSLLLAAAITSFAMLLVAGGLLAYGLHHRDTVYTGASSAGVDLGGRTLPEAQAALQARFDAYRFQPIQLVHGEVTFTATPDELGLEFDAASTAERAYAFGRRASLWQESRNWLDAIAGGHAVAPVMTVRPEPFAAFLETHASGLAVAPREPSIIAADNGELTLDPGAPGIAVDVEASFVNFRDRMLVMSNESVEIVTVPVPPSEPSAALLEALEGAQVLAGEPLRLTLNGTEWEIPAQDLFAMLHIDVEGAGYTVSIDRAELRSFIAALTSQTFAPGVDGTLRNDNGVFIVEPSIPGHKLDVDASVTAALAALETDRRSVPLVTLPVEANVSTAALDDARAVAEQMVATSHTLTWDGGSATIEPDTIARAISFDINPARNPAVILKLDQDIMSGALAGVADAVKAEPRNAELRYINGQVVVRTPEVAGRELDVTATAERMLAAVRSGETSIPVVTRDVLPDVNSQMATTIQFPDVLATGQTEYGSSSADRLHNVELAASRVNGAMVAPGQIFSFNDAAGEVSLASGYRTGYGIIATNGNISTIPSVGGGICQVATTVFHAAFRSGMPIVERSWHLYWIPRYGAAPSGLKGLDATVDADYDLDFTFRNATDHWIAIVARYNGSHLMFDIVGTNPGWEIQIDEPFITNIRPASQEMVYEQNDQLPVGTSVFVEHAEDGFDATIHRVVRKDSQILDEVNLFSSYAPARNVTLVGTRR